MKKRLGLALFSVLAVGTTNWACSSGGGGNPSGTGGAGGEEETGGSTGTTGGKTGSTGGSTGSTGGSTGSTGGSTGSTGGSTGSTGGSTGTGGAGDTGGSTGSTGGSTGSTGGSTGSTGGATGTGGMSGTGGTSGGPLTLKLLGLDETMAHAGGPVFTPAQSNTSNQSPEMQWSGAPAGTKSFVISMIDTQTPPSKTPPLKAGSSTKCHFVIYNIPASATGLPAKFPRVAMPPMPAGTFNSKTFSGFGYFGPGGATSVYKVQLWAMDVEMLPGTAAGVAQQPLYDSISKGALNAHVIGKPVEFLAAGTNGGF
jgi:phosphatidylethanolamine-binding protein (PEBP) family uncharacterized protein